MYYPEYAIAARTHYRSCKSLYDNCCVAENDISPGVEQDILFRLLYLCGHIIECASIYLIYKHFRYDYNPDVKNWNGNSCHLHLTYNRRFTLASHMDFYPVKIENGFIFRAKKMSDGSCVKFGKSRTSDYYCVQSHNFQSYIINIIRTQLPQKVPYLRPDCSEDDDYSEAIQLIDAWTPDLRYYYDGRKSGHFCKDSNNPMPNVNVANIGLVLEICEQIVNLLPSGRQL